MNGNNLKVQQSRWERRKEKGPRMGWVGVGVGWDVVKRRGFIKESVYHASPSPEGC